MTTPKHCSLQETLKKELQGSHLFLVDESPSFLAGLRDLFEPYACKVEMFTNPEKALDSLSSCQPDVLITSLEMKTLSGLELLTHIHYKHTLPFFPIIVLTEQHDPDTLPDTLIEVLLGGASDLISKNTLVRPLLLAKILAMKRLKLLHQELTETKQVRAIKTLIGTYKHEFGNAIAILEGRCQQIVKKNPNLKHTTELQSIEKTVVRLIDTLKKLDQLRHDQEKEDVN